MQYKTVCSDILNENGSINDQKMDAHLSKVADIEIEAEAEINQDSISRLEQKMMRRQQSRPWASQ